MSQSQPKQIPRDGPVPTPFRMKSDAFTSHLCTVRLKKGQCVYDQDRSINTFHLVRQGLLGIFRHVYPDKKILVQKIGSGSSTGLTHCLGDSPFPGQLIPIKETVAYRGTTEEAKHLSESCPADVNRLLVRENEKNGDIVRKIDDIIGKELETRIADELLALASRIGQSTDDGIRLVVKLSRKQISNMTGSAYEFVIRIISRWEKKDWIKTEHKHITILRPQRLETL